MKIVEMGIITEEDAKLLHGLRALLNYKNKLSHEISQKNNSTEMSHNIKRLLGTIAEVEDMISEEHAYLLSN